MLIYDAAYEVETTMTPVTYTHYNHLPRLTFAEREELYSERFTRMQQEFLNEFRQLF